MPKGRKALVTGASRGIGRAIAVALAEAGAGFIVVHYRNSRDGAEETCRLCRELGSEAVALQAEMGSPDEVARLAREATAAGGGSVELLVNNAGIRRDGLFAMMSSESIREVIEVNLVAPIMLTRHLLREMLKARYGRILNIASGAGVAGNAGQTNYAASKGGLIVFTKSLAREVARYDVLVNCLAPGLVDTDMTASMNPKARDAMTAAIPLGRTGRPEEVAAAACFLLGRKSSYITGQLVSVNGGLLT